MPLIIEEIEAQVTPAGVETTAPPHPAEGGEQEEILDLLELAAERQERLRVD
jgi:hypothetical protein